MTEAGHGAASRKPAYSGTRRIPGLYERTLADGSSVYDVALRLGGKVRRHRLAARTKTDAIAELRALQVDYERGEQHRSAAAALTVAELASDWLAHLEARVGHRDPKRRYSARTVALYRQRLEQHIVPALGSRSVDEVGLADVRRLVDRLGGTGLAPSTVTGILGILSGLLRYAVKGGQLERNPVRDLDRDDRPGTGRLSEPRYLSIDEIAALLENLSDTFRPIIATCTFAGLRISEALGLRWRDVDFSAGTIDVTGQLGTNGERVPVKSPASAAPVRMLPALARELREHRSRRPAASFAASTPTRSSSRRPAAGRSPAGMRSARSTTRATRPGSTATAGSRSGSTTFATRLPPPGWRRGCLSPSWHPSCATRTLA